MLNIKLLKLITTIKGSTKLARWILSYIKINE